MFTRLPLISEWVSSDNILVRVHLIQCFSNRYASGFYMLLRHVRIIITQWHCLFAFFKSFFVFSSFHSHREALNGMFDSKHELLELSSQGYILLPQSLALQVHTVSKGKQRKCKRLLKPLIQVNWLYTFTVEVLIKYRSDNNQQHMVCPVWQ